MTVYDIANGRPRPAFDTARLRQVFGAFPSGVTAVAAIVDGLPYGLAASSFTSVSLDPALVSVCVAQTSTTWPVLERATKLGVSVLSADQEHETTVLSAKGIDRFAQLDWQQTPGGGVLIERASAWFETSVHQVVPAGDHFIVLLAVHDLDIDEAAHPLVFHGSTFRRLAV